MSNLISKVVTNIRFFRGSKKYFISSIFFKAQERRNVRSIYNFCRYFDDIVDNQNDYNLFAKEIEKYFNSYKLGYSNNSVIDSFVKTQHSLDIPISWVEAMFSSFEMDFNKKVFFTLEDTLEYTFGVAEVVGLFMCKALNITVKAHQKASALGRSAQWANFTRDIHEDFKMGRVYFPKEDLEECEIPSLSEEVVKAHKKNFSKFINLQYSRYLEYVSEGEKGLRYMDKFQRKPIVLATEADKLRMNIIIEEPLTVYQKKVDIGFIELLKLSRKAF